MTCCRNDLSLLAAQFALKCRHCACVYNVSTFGNNMAISQGAVNVFRIQYYLESNWSQTQIRTVAHDLNGSNLYVGNNLINKICKQILLKDVIPWQLETSISYSSMFYIM